MVTEEPEYESDFDTESDIVNSEEEENESEKICTEEEEDTDGKHIVEIKTSTTITTSSIGNANLGISHKISIDERSNGYNDGETKSENFKDNSEKDHIESIENSENTSIESDIESDINDGEDISKRITEEFQQMKMKFEQDDIRHEIEMEYKVTRQINSSQKYIGSSTDTNNEENIERTFEVEACIENQPRQSSEDSDRRQDQIDDNRNIKSDDDDDDDDDDDGDDGHDDDDDDDADADDDDNDDDDDESSKEGSEEEEDEEENVVQKEEQDNKMKKVEESEAEYEEEDRNENERDEKVQNENDEEETEISDNNFESQISLQNIEPDVYENENITKDNKDIINDTNSECNVIDNLPDHLIKYKDSANVDFEKTLENDSQLEKLLLEKKNSSFRSEGGNYSVEISSKRPSSYNSDEYPFRLNFINNKRSAPDFRTRMNQNKNLSFSNERMREIERTNQVLLKKILTQKSSYDAKNLIANKSKKIIKNTRQTSAAINRKKQQQQIDKDNQVLKRKLEAIAFRNRVN